MAPIPWGKFPTVAEHQQAHRWLQFMANIGRATNTIDAYGRAVEDHLLFCMAEDVDPLLARPDTVAAWIGSMLDRPLEPVSKGVHRAEAGLANSTIQQRLVAVRSFYEYLVEDGLREQNPVRRGQASRSGRRARQGLVRRIDQAPWIPNKEAWQRILAASAEEPLRNRLMITLAYDGALRREELVRLDVEDFEPAHRLIHLRAETTKSQRSREVAFGGTSSRLFVAYLNERRAMFGRIHGPLFRSASNRNYGAPLGPSSWSKAVERIARKSESARLSTHTLRHLRLTDLARADWTIDQIAQYAGHRDLATTMRYIHLSGRELAARFHRANTTIHADRERLLASLLEER
ncbi:tyrosine-type recombinase/integrase [Streptomyces sp. NPDC127033]|uniref:tyrosine-type recombinase/integrase n=1 Tax=Streptomyces sp. NPDC127033 TaxID=3347110 RepID=UPI00364BAB48